MTPEPPPPFALEEDEDAEDLKRRTCGGDLPRARRGDDPAGALLAVEEERLAKRATTGVLSTKRTTGGAQNWEKNVRNPANRTTSSNRGHFMKDSEKNIKLGGQS